jgi:hypothetical protein
MSQKYTYILWILKNQMVSNFESCSRRRKGTLFRLAHRKGGNSRVQERKIRKDVG